MTAGIAHLEQMLYDSHVVVARSLETMSVTMKRLLAPLALLVGVTACGACESGGGGQTKEAESSTPSSAQSEKGVQKRRDDLEETAQPSGSPHEDRLQAGDVPPVGTELELTESEWRERLTKKEFHILREKGTEPPRSGELLDNKRTGIYYCAGCGAPLFSSRHKYDSGTGWPSFYKPYDPKRILERPDRSMGMTRTEIICARCKGHLGHVFDDGPEPTGERYCINSLALDFKPVEEAEESEAEEADPSPSGETSKTESSRGTSSQ